MKLISIGLSFCCFAGIVSAEQAPIRPGYHGLSPAYPTVDSIPSFEIKAPFLISERACLLNLEIDKDGTARKCRPVSDSDSLFSAFVFSSLKKLKFHPALKDGKAVKSELVFKVTLSPRFRFTSIEFPVDASGEIKSRDLYFKSMEKLGVKPPQIKIFPSYFCDFKPNDSLDVIPFTLLKLKLDTAGRAIEITEIKNTADGFSSQVQSAVLWSSFQPLLIGDKPQETECFLLVSFLPQVQYPTMRIDISKETEFPWYDRFRVRLLPDTVGTMIPALPKKLSLEIKGLTKMEKRLFGDVIAAIDISTTGKVVVKSTDNQDASFHKSIRRFVEKNMIFPAMDFAGNPVRFSGKSRFLFNGKPVVHFELLWLDERY